MVDLAAYFDRIGFVDAARPDLATLTRLHYAHALTIPFENLTTLLHEPVPLDLAALEHKLVASGRGGYCFEQNSLFRAVLEAVGFDVTPLAARVVWGRAGEGPTSPRTHMVLLVRLDDETWIADVGFGGATLTAPLRLVFGVEQSTPHESFRLLRLAGELELQIRLGDDWRPVYRFDLQPQQPIDYEVLNHYVATHPSSHFRSVLIAGRPFEDGRYALADNALATHRLGAATERRTLESARELRQALTDLFGITLPSSAALDTKLAEIASRPPRD